MRHLKLISALGVAGLLVAAGLAVAQTYPPPTAPTIHNNTDLIAIVPNGIPSAQSQYVPPAEISNAPGYVKVTPTTAIGSPGYYNTFAANQSYMIVVLTTTMPYSYNYTAASPSDGARECISGSGGAITQATLWATAASGQTVTGGSNVSVSSNSSACWTYSLQNLTWDRS